MFQKCCWKHIRAFRARTYPGVKLRWRRPYAGAAATASRQRNIKTARLPSCKNCVSLDELLMINTRLKLVVSAGAASASLIVTQPIMSPCVFPRHKSHICFLRGTRGSWTITLPTANATLEHSAPRLRSQGDGRGTVAQTHTHIEKTTHGLTRKQPWE